VASICIEAQDLEEKYDKDCATLVECFPLELLADLDLIRLSKHERQKCHSQMFATLGSAGRMEVFVDLEDARANHLGCRLNCDKVEGHENGQSSSGVEMSCY